VCTGYLRLDTLSDINNRRGKRFVQLSVPSDAICSIIHGMFSFKTLSFNHFRQAKTSALMTHSVINFTRRRTVEKSRASLYEKKFDTSSMKGLCNTSR